jgi:hypothetical protein
MSGFDENPFGEPTVDNPFAVRINNFVAKYNSQNAPGACVENGFWFNSNHSALCTEREISLSHRFYVRVRIWLPNLLLENVDAPQISDCSGILITPRSHTAKF